jgi:uncharacterized integral membrane protein
MLHRLASLLLMFAFLLLLVVGFIFALRNSSPVGIWLGTEFAPRPLSFWLLGFLLTGIVLGLLVSSGVLRALEISRLRRKVRAQELEIAGLKQVNAPAPVENTLHADPTKSA